MIYKNKYEIKNNNIICFDNLKYKNNHQFSEKKKNNVKYHKKLIIKLKLLHLNIQNCF